MKRWAVLAFVLAIVALPACGDDSDEESADAPATTTTAAEAEEDGVEAVDGRVDVAADPKGALKFIPDELTTTTNAAGQLTVVMENESGDPHNICIEDESGKELLCSAVFTSKFVTNTIEIKPGTYEFYCDVGSHREAGMTGTLTVE